MMTKITSREKCYKEYNMSWLTLSLENQEKLQLRTDDHVQNRMRPKIPIQEIKSNQFVLLKKVSFRLSGR